MYPAQEEALLDLIAGSNVILNTPTGSGKSLVAVAAHFIGLARDERSVYTAPIKALVSEKFFQLCATFGSDLVGMITGDGSVNPDAPIICCTAEILANWALRDGADTDVDIVIADEFHFYADPQRGWAWQLPLLELPGCQFLLMSATLGSTTFFETELTKRTGRETSLVRSAQRPVPLDFEYRTTTLHRSIEQLLGERQGADLPGPLHPARGHRGSPGVSQSRPVDQGREAAGQTADRRLPVRFAVREDVSSIPGGRDRRAPRRSAAEVPAARRTARPGGTAQDHLRYRHARCRCQRADSHGAVHTALQVRRQWCPDPQRARVPADRRARRQARLRRPR